MKYIFLIPFMFLLSCTTGKSKEKILEDLITYQIEKAYFEGQKDALEGDIRIEKDKDSSYYNWTKSPWDNDTIPLFDPSKNTKIKL